MEDRLLELKKGLNPNGNVDESISSDFMAQFSSKVKWIQSALGTVKQNTQEISRLKDQHQTATNSQEEKRVSNELNRILGDNQKICEKVKEQMKLLSDDIESSKQTSPDEPETRFKITTYKALSNKFSDVLKDSQTVQVEFKAAVKTKMARQAKILDENLSDDQVNDVVNDPDGLSKLMQGKLIGPGHTKLQNAVADIQDKFKDIQRLEASVQLVYQMFVDMAMLVHAQGEIIDNIEANVNETKSYVLKAEKKLADAKENHIAYKKKACCITCLVLIAVVFLLHMTGLLDNVL